MRIFPIITREMVADLVESKYRGVTRVSRMQKIFESKYRVRFSPRGLNELTQKQVTSIYKDINKIK